MRHLALFVMGRSPAILAETLAALADDPPDAVRIVTTEAGREALAEALEAEDGWARFVREWPEYARLSPADIEVRVPEGVADIRDHDTHKRMSEAILAAVDEGVATSGRLSASLAGGRKTMGYMMGLAMTLLGRPQDRLLHVLAPPEWERPGFFAPPRAGRDRIRLVDVPFVRLRGHLKPAAGRVPVERLAEAAQRAVDLAMQPRVVLHVRRRVIESLGREIELPPREFAIYQFFAEEKLHRCREPERALCGDCRACFLDVDAIEARKAELIRMRAQFGGMDHPQVEKFRESWSVRHAARTNLAEPLRRIAEQIEQAFSVDPRAEALRIVNVGPRGQPRYGLLAERAQIEVRMD